MADIVLKVTPNELSTKAGEFGNHRTQMLRLLAQSKTAVNALRSGWTGPAAEDFYAKFNTLYASCETVLNEMQKHQKVLNEAAQIYRSSESAVKSNVEKLPSSGVFK